MVFGGAAHEVVVGDSVAFGVVGEGDKGEDFERLFAKLEFVVGGVVGDRFPEGFGGEDEFGVVTEEIQPLSVVGSMNLCEVDDGRRGARRIPEWRLQGVLDLSYTWAL